ncbi:uncharacterized protein BX663DRAFT_499487 [Cokeromyces recurvatus]|uniref:uncharacterized protein n=1 Tax=Cokeromyces recurvatus TaxID=90255 RepID=UPI0022203A1D|nr:uncharacterized protein BX663DRAFT_499487 [Cokeromyces recurvatus]KAI7905370.1 hypothetical protein BX663DRAFT_499487 [Cokeromyces recurvatus]
MSSYSKIKMASIESLLWIGSSFWVFYRLFKIHYLDNHVIAGWIGSIWLGILLVRISTKSKRGLMKHDESSSSSTTATTTAAAYSSSEDDKGKLKKRIHNMKQQQVYSMNRIFGASKSSFRGNADDGLKCGVLLLPMVAVAKLIDASNNAMDEYYMAYLQVRIELIVFMSILFLLLVFINDYLHPLKRIIRKRGLFISSICVAALCTTVLTNWTSLTPQLSQQTTNLTIFSITIFQWFLYICVVTLKKCFTLGEMCIISQAGAVVVHGATEYIYSAYYPEQAPSYIHYGDISTVTVLSHAVVVGMIFIGILTYPLLRQSRRLAQKPYWRSSIKTTNNAKIICGIAFYFLTAIIVFFIIAPLCKTITGENPFMWTLDFLYMSPSRMVLCLYWALMVITTVVIWVLVLDFYPQPSHDYYSSLETKILTSALNKKRKLFHALAVIMFVPGVLFEKIFLQLAFSVALSGFIYLEYLRYFAIWPWGKSLHVFLTEFIDSRDLGPVILSHIYLLLGCASPVWLGSSNVLASLAGILSLGFGDAAASLVGKYMGRIVWPGTKKTVEGTIAFIMTIFVSSIVVVYIAAIISVDNAVQFVALAGRGKWLSYLVIITLAGLLEAFSTQNDNIIIPLYMYVLVVLSN